MADIILPGKIRPLASSLEPDLDALSDDERLALGKQQRLTDVLKTGRLELDADRRFGEAVEALKQDEGVSNPDFLSRADGTGDQIMQEMTEAIPGEVSDGAREAFLRTLGNRRKDYDLDMDALRGVTRTRDGLALVEDVVGRAVETVQREPFRLKDRLDDLDRVAGDMGTALAPLREDALQDRRASIVTAAVKGMVAQGQGDKAQLLLDSGVLDDRLAADRLARLKQTATSLTQAYDQDQRDAEQHKKIEAVRARQANALGTTAAIRARIQDGEATETEIAAAETDGVLSPAQAGRLRAKATAARARQNAISVRVDRITSMLDSGGRPNPQDPDSRNDVARHYDATVKSTLAGLDPARKAAAIAGYVVETGVAPEAALDTLLALTATGDPANRIAAARELTSVLTTAPAARDKVPPMLAEYAAMVVSLAELDALAPEDIVGTAEKVFGDGNADPDAPSPALLQLAQLKRKATSQANNTDIGKPDDVKPSSDALPGPSRSDEPLPTVQSEKTAATGPQTGKGDTTNKREPSPDVAADADRPIGEDLLTGYQNEYLAAQQGTSPVVRRIDGSLNYRYAPKNEQDLFDEHNLVSDPSKYVVLRDPETNRLTVFQRSPNTDEGGIARAIRLIGLGFATDPIRFSKRGVSKAVTGAIPKSAKQNRVATGDRRYVTRGNRAFVALEDGSIDFGYISEDIAKSIGRIAAPIRLPRGDQKFGELHISQPDRAAQIKKFGIEDPAELVHSVASQYSEVWQAKGTSLLLVRRSRDKAQSLFIELKRSEIDATYEVISGGIFRGQFPKGGNRKLLWSR